MDEKDKYFEIFQTDRNYISTIEPLILTVNYTVTNVRLDLPRHSETGPAKSGDTNITASPHTHFYLKFKSLLTALSRSESTH